MDEQYREVLKEIGINPENGVTEIYDALKKKQNDLRGVYNISNKSTSEEVEAAELLLEKIKAPIKLYEQLARDKRREERENPIEDNFDISILKKNKITEKHVESYSNKKKAQSQILWDKGFLT